MDRWVPLFCMALISAIGLADIAGCHHKPTPAEVSGRARNAAAGGRHAVDLALCIDLAKRSDAGPREFQVYEDCAARADLDAGRQ